MDDWTSVMALEDLPEGKPVGTRVDGEPVLLLRDGDRILAASNRCTHQGAPVHGGRLEHLGGGVPVVTCPAHGSRFQLTDGRVLRGPATKRLPIYEVRVTDGTVEVRSTD